MFCVELFLLVRILFVFLCLLVCCMLLLLFFFFFFFLLFCSGNLFVCVVMFLPCRDEPLFNVVLLFLDVFVGPLRTGLVYRCFVLLLVCCRFVITACLLVI